MSDLDSDVPATDDEIDDTQLDELAGGIGGGNPGDPEPPARGGTGRSG